jgi:hypothetical protein
VSVGPGPIGLNPTSQTSATRFGRTGISLGAISSFFKPVGWANHGAPVFWSDLQGGKTGARKNGACRSRPPN